MINHVYVTCNHCFRKTKVRNANRIMRDANKESVHDMRKKGVSYRNIAKHLGLSLNHVFKLSKENQITSAVEKRIFVNKEMANTFFGMAKEHEQRAKEHKEKLQETRTELQNTLYIFHLGQASIYLKLSYYDKLHSDNTMKWDVLREEINHMERGLGIL